MEDYDSSKFLLNAVNDMLITIGENPIEDEVDYDIVFEARIARQLLLTAKAQILTYGWKCNTDTKLEFIPDSDGYIPVPSNILELRNTDGLTIRDWQLYDSVNKTRKFTETQYCDVIWNIDFNTLPYSLRNLITIRASRVFQAKLGGDNNIYKLTERDEQDAYILAKESDGFVGQYNMLPSIDFTVLS